MELIRILFNTSCHLLVQRNSEGIYYLPEVLEGKFKWHKLTEKIACSIIPSVEKTEGEWQTIHDLSYLPKAEILAQTLEDIEHQLYRVPYLDMGKYDYIYN